MNNFGDSEVALAALGVLATAVAGIVWLARYFARELSKDLKEHTKAAIGQQQSNKEVARASKEQAEASREVLAFMKNLNGKLANATIQTIKEQHIDTQVVQPTQVVTDRRKNS